MKDLRDLAIGNRINWPDGCRSAWGAIVDFETRTTQGVNGSVFSGISDTIDVARYPAFDGRGWPQPTPATVT